MITPCGHRCLVQVEQLDVTTEWGFVTSSKENHAREQATVSIGTVISVGSQAYKAFSKDFTGEPWCKPGDKVFFARFAGASVEDPESGESYLLLNDDDICAVITGEKENV